MTSEGMDKELMELFDIPASEDLFDCQEESSFGSSSPTEPVRDLSTPSLTNDSDPPSDAALEVQAAAPMYLDPDWQPILLTGDPCSLDGIPPAASIFGSPSSLSEPNATFCSISDRVQHLLKAGQTTRSPANCSNTGFQNPIPKSGVLKLTDEETRLLLKEGFSLPWSLPLSTDQEHALRRMRRKIKNKISAQDSRKKRKVYVDNLEKNLSDLLSLTQTLRAELQTAQAWNRQLMQRQMDPPRCSACQAEIGNSFRGAGATILMGVLCFAVFLGGPRPAPQMPPAPPGQSLDSLRPALPWVANTPGIPEWRWSPERHFHSIAVPPNYEASRERSKRASRPLVMTVPDGQSRWLSDSADDDEEVGPMFPALQFVTAAKEAEEFRLAKPGRCCLPNPPSPQNDSFRALECALEIIE